MGIASIGGLVSGIDTATMISQLMQLEAIPRTQLQSRVTTQQRQVTALQTLNSKLANLASKAAELAQTNNWQPVKATSSHDKVSVTAAAGTTPGSIELSVASTATASRAVFAASGTLDQVVTTASTQITIDHDNRADATINTGTGSLKDIAAAINNPANNTGLQASLVKTGVDGTGTALYQLHLVSVDTGSGGSFTVGAAGFLGGVVTSPTGAMTYATTGAQITFPAPPSATYTIVFADGGTQNFDYGNAGSLQAIADAVNNQTAGVTATVVAANGTQRLHVMSDDGRKFQIDPSGSTTAPFLGGPLVTTAGTNASLTVNGQTLTSSSNTITGVMPGVDVTLAAGATGTATVAVTRDTQSLSDKVKAMVEAANAALADIDSLTAYNATTKTAGLLSGDSALRSIRSELLATVTAGVDGASLATYGIQVDRTGKLSFDAGKFTTAYNADPAGTRDKFAGTMGFAAGPGNTGTVELHTTTWRTLPGTFNISVTGTAGSIDGVLGTLAGGVLTAASGSRVDGLAVKVTGDVSGTVSVKQGFAAKVDALAQRASDATIGTVSVAIKGRNDRIDRLEDDIDRWDVRLETRRAALERQYAALEVALGKMQSQGNWLAGQLASLPKMSSGN